MSVLSLHGNQMLQQVVTIYAALMSLMETDIHHSISNIQCFFIKIKINHCKKSHRQLKVPILSPLIADLADEHHFEEKACSLSV